MKAEDIQYMDRVRVWGWGFGDVWCFDTKKGTAFVQFGDSGPITRPIDELEFVSRRVR